jgi:uncharacterized protein YecE (DUF72 family)
VTRPRRVPAHSVAHRARIGISGWKYAPWRGVFYPLGLRQAAELSFASRAFPSIELNGSFYSLQRPQSYRAWYDATPDDFIFAVKGGRYITHMKRLRDVKPALANFFASGLLCLGKKLGPILWQLPPSFRFDVDVLRAFFELLPRTPRAIERLARDHDARLLGRTQVEATSEDFRVRYALEVRHESFVDPRYLTLLRDYGVASCIADSAGRYPVIEEATADFAYVRLHGAKELYVSGYSPAELSTWAKRIRKWQRRQEVFVYFDNDVKVHAPFDARNLALILAGKPTESPPPSIDDVTEEARTSWPAWKRSDQAR